MENIDFGLLEAVLVLSGIAAGFLVNSFGLGDRIWNKGADHQRTCDKIDNVLQHIRELKSEIKEIKNKVDELEKKVNDQSKASLEAHGQIKERLVTLEAGGCKPVKEIAS